MTNKMNTINALKSINYRLYVSLLLTGLVPTLYTTLRVFFIGEMPGEYSYSIAGQLAWVNLIFEVVQEAIILPLFFFIGEVAAERKARTNRTKTGLVMSAGIYTVFAAIVIIFARPMLGFMAASTDIIDASVTYLRLESVAIIFSTICSFLMVVLVTIGKEKYLYTFTAVKLVVTCAMDTVLVSSLPFSLKLGVNGIAISNIIINLVLDVALLLFLRKEDIDVFSRDAMDFGWAKLFTRQGIISGSESFVRNFAYSIMICRMVNVVGEQGTYWMANNFIWGWMLLPILQLGELIKRDCGTDRVNAMGRIKGYFALTGIICALWVILIPTYKPFIGSVLNYGETDTLFHLIMVLFIPYVFFAFQNIFDSVFYGHGKSEYMLAESIITNTVYYGAAFILYKNGIFVPTLTGIAVMFGLGNIFDAFVSWGAYVVFKKRQGYR